MNLREMLNADSEEADMDELWQGMPDYEQEDQLAFRTILMHFTKQEDVNDFAALVGQAITDKTKYLYHPKQEKQDMKAYRVQDES